MAFTHYLGEPEFIKDMHFMLSKPFTVSFAEGVEWKDENGVPITYAKKGTVVSLVDGLAVPYDGVNTPLGILWYDVTPKGERGGVAMIHGRVDKRKLIGYDEAVDAALPNISFEDEVVVEEEPEPPAGGGE